MCMKIFDFHITDMNSIAIHTDRNSQNSYTLNYQIQLLIRSIRNRLGIYLL